LSVSSYRLFQAWIEILRLSRVRSDETICILTRKDIYQENVDAAEFALESLGAKFFRLHPSLSGHSLVENTTAMNALKTADMIIDFLGLHLLRNYEQEIVREAGTRVLYVVEPPDTLLRLMPTSREKAEVVAAAERLASARTMHVTSPHGTDFTASFGEYRVQAQWGYSDEPAHWDHWPSGFLVRWPNEASARGRIVLAPGDTIFSFRAYVQTPVTLTIDKGYITAIEGGLDADWLKNFMGRYDREAYAVSHLGWGLSETADWGALHLVDKSKTNGNDARASRGNFMFSTGPNTDAGGKRNTLCHFDMPMRNCSLELDGKPVLRDGHVI
jgi:2,5-dihydroxypyridine 5,6-dioxygenase